MSLPLSPSLRDYRLEPFKTVPEQTLDRKRSRTTPGPSTHYTKKEEEEELRDISDSADSTDANELARKHNRVRTGCFCCRKRKKKCDETSPACNACIRNRIKCIYPTMHNEPLPPNFSLEEATYGSAPWKAYKKRRSRAEYSFVGNSENTISTGGNPSGNLFNVIVLNPSKDKKKKSKERQSPAPETPNNRYEYFNMDLMDITRQAEPEPEPKIVELSTAAAIVNILQGEEPPLELNSNSPITESSVSPRIFDTESEDYSESERPSPFSSVISHAKSYLATRAGFSPYSELSMYVPNTYLSPRDLELYHHFIQSFVPSISLPHSHPLLSPGHIWVSMGSQSKILTDVFLCCGASFLAYSHGNSRSIGGSMNPPSELSTYCKNVAEVKYRNILEALRTGIQNKEIDLESDWLVTVGLTLCIRDRHYGMNGSRVAKHLTFVYNLLKRRDHQKKLLTKTIQQANETNLSTSSSHRITPTDRLFIDSFVFNYSTALLSCSKKDLITLPSPYDFFGDIRQWLDFPIYEDCDMVWMNNPVMGSAIDSFEIYCKLTWLLRLHFEDAPDANLEGGVVDKQYMSNEIFWDLVLPLRAQIDITEAKIEGYLNDVEALKKPDLKTNHSYERLRSNLAVAFIVLNSSRILVEKLINPILPSYVPVIQNSVNSVYSELKKIPPGNHTACLSTMCLFIAGIATIHKEQREYLSTELREMSNSMASCVGNNILKVLQLGWEKEEFDRSVLRLGDQGYKCFDLLFDRTYIEQITF